MEKWSKTNTDVESKKLRKAVEFQPIQGGRKAKGINSVLAVDTFWLWSFHQDIRDNLRGELGMVGDQ